MKGKKLKTCLILLLTLVMIGYTMTLKESYDAAGPAGEYDKYIVLEKGKVYKGGLFLGKFFNPVTLEFEDADERSVCIKGNGAIIDLMNGQIHLAYSKHKLDIDSCVIINGTLRYNGHPQDSVYITPYGKVKNVTFYKSIDYGVRMEGAGDSMDVSRNLVVNCISTRGDFEQHHSTPSDIIRTGTSFAFSLFGWYGYPEIVDNWSYNIKSLTDSLLHFSML